MRNNGQIPLIHPDCLCRVVWEIYVLIITITITISAPLRVIFLELDTTLLLVCDTIGMLTYIFDIILKFNTGILQHLEVVTDRRIIARQYIKKYFLWDIIAAIPFTWFFSASGMESANTLFRFFILFRLFKLVSITSTLQRAHRLKFIKPAFARMILLVFWILIAAHLIASGWILIDGPRKEITGIEPTPNSIYLEAYYWTVTTLTTIGYGDITPETSTQFIYTIVVMLIGAALYGFIIGNIANIIANIDVAKSKFRERMENISTFLQYRNMPKSLQNRITKYYDYLWETRRGYEESEILHDLPALLKTEVSLFLNRNIIERVPIFKNASPEFIREIVMNLEPVVYAPGDNIVIYGEQGSEMFFINIGKVEVLNEDASIYYATLTSGQFFGEIALLLSTPRTATVKAKGYCDLYKLEKKTFDSILTRYPDFAKDVEKQAEDNRRKLGLT
ncbi:MAG: hypothetical protein B0D92_02550 [Spirochaeta sp. LUC14_002_19_P3]|nr:MAG: hypothetical protein B0D92_02550 [Spirochaeta sp. LUC14_002_19_P3]